MPSVTFKVQGEFITRLARERLYYEHNLNYAMDLLMSCTKTDQLSEAEHIKLCVDILEGRKEIRGVYPEDDYGVYDTAPTKRTPGIMSVWEKREQEIKALERKLNLMTQKFIFVAEELGDWDIEKLNRKWHELMYDPSDPDRETAAPPWLFPDHESATENSGILGAFSRIFGSDGEEDLSDPETALGSHLLADYMRGMRVNRGDDYGWLNPKGEFFPVDWGDHQSWAADYIKEHPEEFDLPDEQHARMEQILHWQADSQAGDRLCEKGWILLHSTHHGVARPTRDESRRITKAQREFLYGYYTDRGLRREAEQYIED